MRYSVLKTSNQEPLDIEYVKAHLNALPNDSDEDDLIIEPLITSAREYCENITGRAFIPQTIRAYPDVSEQVILLPRPPITKIDSITLYHDGNTSETLSADSDYSCDPDNGLLVFHVNLSGLRDFNPIVVEYEAGYAKLPQLLQEAMRLLIGHWYANRESVQTGSTTAVELPQTTLAILRQYKQRWC